MRRAYILLSSAAAAVLAACACHSPAAPATRSSLAVHLDSLASAEANSPNVEWFNVLVQINAAVARGVVPANVSITVDGTPVTFSAVAVKWLDTVDGHSPVALDSAWTLLAWTGDRD